MKSLCLLAAGLCLVLLACGKIDVRGYIINEEGKRIQGAVISASKADTETQSDKKGYFLLSNVEANDTLVVSAPGYQPVRCRALQRMPWLIILKKENEI